MSNRNFREMLEEQWSRGKFVSVGLDSELAKMPQFFREHASRYDEGSTIAAFNRDIVEATKDIVCAYKPNTAFYEAYGRVGIAALYRTIADIHLIAPDVPVILDAKRADIGNTNAGYVKFAFDHLKADAITVHPYLGAEALQPFLDRTDKGVIVLCRTSNPGAGEFQDVRVVQTAEEALRWGSCMRPMAFYQLVAYRVAREWNKNGNCMLVVGATYPDELREVREIVGDMPILIPGIGAQGGDLEKTVAVGKDSRGKGMIINSSRGIIHASAGEDYAASARRETEKLNGFIGQFLAKK